MQPAVCLLQELFTALLISPVALLGAGAHKDDKCDITVADILGLLEAGTGAGEAADGIDRTRDGSFSLLSYSYSLVGSCSTTSNRQVAVY